MHTFIGNAGHFFVVAAFITSLVAAYAYIQATYATDLDARSWRRYARSVFYIHGAMVVGVVFSLFYIIYNHYFEYHYAWEHSSRSLPVYYMISCFWEGQEGSFLLWIFWEVVLGIILIQTNKDKKWEAPVMAVFSLVQAFLASMILGVVIGSIKIGSSPFILLRDVLDAPVFALNPDFVPEDGTGLNPLLQNYWMVIHPPTLFLGFATTLVPFAFCIAGLWKKDFENWVKPALPWSIFSAAVLGLGIAMGAYWAYETLNFGGYWNWDPVENAVYVPWLVLVASIHTLIIFKNNRTALKTSIVLVIGTFVMVLYSTFLTRSGILGNASVHSFTDLGLSGQLLVYMLFFTIGAIVLTSIHWKSIPTSDKEASAYSREFWIFIGATTLCLMGFQVLVPTSIPVYNAIVEGLGGISNVAPPADQIEFYTKFQLWFAVVVALLSGTGQFFFWKKMDKEKLKNELAVPLIITLLLSALIILIGKIADPAFIALITAAVYSVVANTSILIRLAKAKVQLIGGSVAHIGVAMILIGILFSAGYSKVISVNNSGRMIFENATQQDNLENVVLWYGESREIADYTLLYKGQKKEVKGIPFYIDKSLLRPTEKTDIAVAEKDFYKNGKKYFSAGDSLAYYPENTYHEIIFTSKKDKSQFTLYPRSQVNPGMGGLIASPDIHKTFSKDLYAHVSAIPKDDEEKQWSETENMDVKIGERFFLNDYVATLEGIEKVDKVEGVDLGPEDLAVQAKIKVLGSNENYELTPVYVIHDRMVGRVPFTLDALGLKVSLLSINPDKNSFTLGVNTTQKDYVVLKAIEKPWINILWMGTLVLMLGFGIAIYKRYQDYVKQDKGESKSDSKRSRKKQSAVV